MKVQIQKWGNTLALRVPKSFAVESRIEQGTLVDQSVAKGKPIVGAIVDKEYTLDELLAGGPSATFTLKSTRARRLGRSRGEGAKRFALN